jgi:amino acid transporter
MEKSNSNKKSRRTIFSEGPTLLRSLNLTYLTFIGVGTAIGASIFVITGHAIETAGPAIILTYLFGAFSALTDGASYAELASSISSSGGGYYFVSRAFKGIPAFLAGWFSWMGNIVDCSVGAIAFSLSVWYYIRWIEPFSLAIITLLIFAVINYRGVKSLSLSETILTSILIIGIIFYIGSASLSADFTRLSPIFPNGILPPILMIAYIFPTFAGYENIATMSEEVKIAGKNIPRAIFLTILISTILFTGLTIATLVAAPPEIYTGSPTPIQDAANYFIGPVGAFLIAICSITASLTTVNGTMAAATRVSYALSRDGLLPPFFDKIHLKHKIPYRTLMLTVIISILFVLTRSIDLIVYMVSLGYIVTSVLVGLSVIQLRRKEPHLFRPFKVPFYPYATIIAIATTAIMIPMLSIEALALGLIFAVVGLITLTLTKRVRINNKQKTGISIN